MGTDDEQLDLLVLHELADSVRRIPIEEDLLLTRLRDLVEQDSSGIQERRRINGCPDAQPS
jgi:hypothetical protein